MLVTGKLVTGKLVISKLVFGINKKSSPRRGFFYAFKTSNQFPNNQSPNLLRSKEYRNSYALKTEVFTEFVL